MTTLWGLRRSAPLLFLLLVGGLPLILAQGGAGSLGPVRAAPSEQGRPRFRAAADGSTAGERTVDVGPGCSWASGFEIGDIDGLAGAFAVFDDGSGPALYAGGSFLAAGTLEAHDIARWDGTAWSALGGPSGASDRIRALAVYDDGNGEALFVGGKFATVAGLEVNNIARWDGMTWSPLSGPSGVGTDG